MVPHQARAACRDTHSPGATWRRSVLFWGYPDLALAYFTFLPCRPFRQTGLARGGVRRGATKTSHRDGTGCDLRRCGGALPTPHTVTHFSRISIGISFQTTPNLSFRGLFGSAVSPAPTWAGLGRARSIHFIPHTLALARRLGGGFATTTQATKPCILSRKQFASTFKDATCLQPPSRLHSNTAVVPSAESERYFLAFHFFFFFLFRLNMR